MFEKVRSHASLFISLNKRFREYRGSAFAWTAYRCLHTHKPRCRDEENSEDVLEGEILDSHERAAPEKDSVDEGDECQHCDECTTDICALIDSDAIQHT